MMDPIKNQLYQKERERVARRMKIFSCHSDDDVGQSVLALSSSADRFKKRKWPSLSLQQMQIENGEKRRRIYGTISLVRALLLQGKKKKYIKK